MTLAVMKSLWIVGCSGDLFQFLMNPPSKYLSSVIWIQEEFEVHHACFFPSITV